MLRAQGVRSVVVVVGAAALMCVFMYIIFCDTRAPKQQQVEKSFLPLLTLDCHYSLGSLFMFFVILLFFSLSPHPVFFAFGPQGQAHGGTT